MSTQARLAIRARWMFLLTYGQNQSREFRRAATYVDRILKGARPADAYANSIAEE